MLATLFLAALTLTLFLYWFRYMCLLILNARTFRDYASEIAAINRLSFPLLREELRHLKEQSVMAPYHQVLSDEYDLLTYLLRNAPTYEVAARGVELRMLMVDFRLMMLWFRLTRNVSHDQARSALVEMAEVVSYIANSMGESCAVGAEA